jgi:hypothetical protein
VQQDAASNLPEREPRVFTVRAVILGLCGCVLIAGFSYLNDYKLKQTYLVGNHLPMAIYVALFLFLIIVNPLLSWLRAKRAWLGFLRPLSAGELVLALSMTLVTASLPTSGLMRYFPQVLVMPQHYGRAIPDWQRAQPFKYINETHPGLFPTRDDKGLVYDGYAQGLPRSQALPPLQNTPTGEWLGRLVEGTWQHLQRIPFGAWYAPAATWFPVLIVYFIFIIMMLRIVHRQWSENEQLAYPIAEFANTLIKRDSRRLFSDIFYERKVWFAFAAVVVYHIINGWHAYDIRMIEIKLNWNLGGIFWSKMQFFHHSVGHFSSIYAGSLFLTVVAFAYFVPEEISFSLGITVPLLMLISSTSYALGHSVTGIEHRTALYGAYAATAFLILYTGRHYYASVLKAAFLRKASSDVDAGAIWACRWFVLAALGLVLGMMSLGLDWLLATLSVLIMGIVFLVLARASAETGIVFMQSYILSKDVIIRLLGPAALGPAAMYVLQLTSSTFMMDSRECLSPFVANGLRMGEKNGVRLPALGRAMLVALVIGLVASGIGVLWVIYDQGALGDPWGGVGVPNGFAAEISRDVQKLNWSGKLEQATQVSGLGRLWLAETTPNFWTFFLIGAGLVSLNSFLRLRYVWWPLHSVVFLFWGTWAAASFLWSFLLGWLIKVCIVRFGGGRFYQDLKPLFVGVILGDLSGGVLLMIYGTLRYCWTGAAPVPYSIFPG